MGEGEGVLEAVPEEGVGRVFLHGRVDNAAYGSFRRRALHVHDDVGGHRATDRVASEERAAHGVVVVLDRVEARDLHLLRPGDSRHRRQERHLRARGEEGEREGGEVGAVEVGPFVGNHPPRRTVPDADEGFLLHPLEGSHLGPYRGVPLNGTLADPLDLEDQGMRRGLDRRRQWTFPVPAKEAGARAAPPSRGASSSFCTGGSVGVGPPPVKDGPRVFMACEIAVPDDFVAFFGRVGQSPRW